MLRLKVGKTSLYRLVAEYTSLPSIRRTDFWKSYKKPRYHLEWSGEDGRGKAILMPVSGRPVLIIAVYDIDGSESARTFNISVDSLRDRGMLEDFVTAAERRKLERGADNGGLSPAT